MAKKNPDGASSDAPSPDVASLAPHLEVRLHARIADRRSPDQYEVLLGGKRIAYVAATPEMPISLLPASDPRMRLPTLTEAEVRELVDVVRTRLGAILAAEQGAAGPNLDELLAGGPPA